MKIYMVKGYVGFSGVVFGIYSTYELANTRIIEIAKEKIIETKEYCDDWRQRRDKYVTDLLRCGLLPREIDKGGLERYNASTDDDYIKIGSETLDILEIELDSDIKETVYAE
jgi:hypothetical protein